MTDGYAKAAKLFVDSRVESIMTGQEYALLLDGIYQGMERNLSIALKDFPEKEREDLIDDLKGNIFDQVYQLTKSTYRTAYKDVNVFLHEYWILPK